ncbi:MAG: hypothetical protein ACRYF5_10870, partial [Janthinobacterium lividum]
KQVARPMDANDDSAFVFAVDRRATSTLHAFKAILEQVPAQDRRFVLLGNDGGARVRAALRRAGASRDGKGVCQAYAELLALVPRADREGLLPREMFARYKLAEPRAVAASS